MNTYYTLSLYNNNQLIWCMAFKSEKHAYEEMLKEYANRQLQMEKARTQIINIEKDMEITDEYDEEGNVIPKRGRKKEPKMLGFDCLCKGNITLSYVLGEEEGDIEKLDAEGRFSD